jgi:hypothetical protein
LALGWGYIGLGKREGRWYYRTPPVWSFSMAHWGGTPTAETKSFAPLEMKISRSSARLPLV